MVIIDFPDCLDAETIRAYEQRGAKVVVLARDDDDLTLSNEQIAPLSGILTYDLSGDAFVRSLRLIYSGERVFPRNFALRQTGPAPSSDVELEGGAVRLSPREREVLVQLVEGYSNKAIARILGMSEATVKVHLKSVLRKIRVENRTQAATWRSRISPSSPRCGLTRRRRLADAIEQSSSSV